MGLRNRGSIGGKWHGGGFVEHGGGFAGSDMMVCRMGVRNRRSIGGKLHSGGFAGNSESLARGGYTSCCVQHLLMFVEILRCRLIIIRRV